VQGAMEYYAPGEIAVLSIMISLLLSIFTLTITACIPAYSIATFSSLRASINSVNYDDSNHKEVGAESVEDYPDGDLPDPHEVAEGFLTRLEQGGWTRVFHYEDEMGE